MWYTKKRREKFSLRFSALYCLEKPGIEVSKYFQETAEKGVIPFQSSIEKYAAQMNIILKIYP